ncbi:MAG: tetratricopeptide repeat protein [Candidatus Obscuribacterales bacterium]|nr:tetratricopeptide repeat protein [Candidatus Obscuribacterales bacterium]
MRLFLAGLIVLNLYLMAHENAWAVNEKQQWMELREKGSREFKLGNYDNAAEIIQAALSLAKKLSDDRYALTLGDLARIKQAEKQTKQAETLLEQALKLSEDSLWPSHPDALRLRKTLISVCITNANYDRAEILLKKQIAILKTDKIEENEFLESLAQLAALYQATNKLDQAIDCTKARLALRSSGSNYFDLAQLYRLKQKWDQAEFYYKESLKKEQSGLTLYFLAYSCAAQAKYDEAERIYLQALAYFKESEGESGPQSLNCFEALAIAYSDAGQYQKAEDSFKKLLALKEKTYGSSSHELAAGLPYYAACFLKQKKMSEAELVYKQIIAIYEKNRMTAHPNYAAAQASLARLKQKTSD